MSSITTELAAALGAVDRPGDFYASGMAELRTPRLEVEGVGLVALPILPIQVAQLVAAAERAPYGRGQDTLVDTTVRRTWQIEAGRVRIKGKHWAPMLEAVLTRVAEGLGVRGPIEAELYKLLVYDKGSFFVSHRDTEKVPGMFATLVLVLPSTSTGGELVVRHQGREVRLDLKCADPSELAFAAFYADCVHEVLPITSGCRVALVYNLTRRAKGALPQPPSYDAEQTRVTALLRAWVVAQEAPDDPEPTKLIYLLEHAYTEAELGFDNLKGADAAVAGVVRAAAQKSECDLHVALFSIHESGSAEYVSGGGRWSEPELEAGEVHERVVMLSQWRRPDGSQPMFAELPVEDGELSPPDAVEEMEPDEEEFEEATGNAGASFERTYRRAALVVWPVKRAFAVLTQAGLGVTLPYLADLTERWASSDASERSALWGQARELTACMLAQWSMRGRHQWKDNTSDVTRILTLLTRLKDTAHIDAFLSGVLGHGLHDKSDNKAIVIALQMLSPERAVALIERMITASTRSPAICSDLLARAVVALADNPGRLAEAAKVLVGALPGGSAHDSWSRPTGVSPNAWSISSALCRGSRRPWHLVPQTTSSPGPRLMTSTLFWCRPYASWPRKQLSTGRGPSSASGLCAWNIFAPASQNPWRSPRIGAAPARLLAIASIAASSAAFSPIPWRRHGTSRPPHRTAAMSSKSSRAPIAISMSAPKHADAPTASSARRTSRATSVEPGSASGIKLIFRNWTHDRAVEGWVRRASRTLRRHDDSGLRLLRIEGRQRVDNRRGWISQISRDRNVLALAIAPIEAGELTREVVGASLAAESAW